MFLLKVTVLSFSRFLLANPFYNHVNQNVRILFVCLFFKGSSYCHITWNTTKTLYLLDVKFYLDIGYYTCLSWRTVCIKHTPTRQQLLCVIGKNNSQIPFHEWKCMLWYWWLKKKLSNMIIWKWGRNYYQFSPFKKRLDLSHCSRVPSVRHLPCHRWKSGQETDKPLLTHCE